MAEDPELKAIRTIIELMQPLDETGRSRVLEYVLKRLDMGTFQSDGLISEMATVATVPYETRTSPIKDIRTLTAEKQPRSANEMVAVIAYYLSEVASPAEASSTINVETIRKYFKMAAFPMPRAPTSALTNAAAAGYLENTSRGEYRLSATIWLCTLSHDLMRHNLQQNSAASGDKRQWLAARPKSRSRHRLSC
ncbi:hypothetical protein [Bradyrhizobium sp. CCGUVB14]|uniref:hypothetical protein n=1 Tax=Bradyrhizobium sp. CCGUVB14 TaxID=2949628 RepID=UPI0020B189B6|nr:hypothetical protein [Bradyrhizobium sp. CCGUVB14]MCP3444079.1 hypothetical protein [Bradyrhizobium sp. CCGUVB14]